MPPSSLRNTRLPRAGLSPFATAPSAASISARRPSTISMRSYASALEKLSQLQSNRSTTQLFAQEASPQALNAAALPEMLLWLRRAGYQPHDLARMRHVHVAGTKGKGSVCAYATAMLRRYGPVGTYTSPHLMSPRERIAVDGEPLGRDEFAEAFFTLWDRFTEAARGEGRSGADAEGAASKPFFFRFLTIMAWHVFLARGVGSVVMECGIGGEYDATNVLPPEAVSVAVITQLGIDHTAMLGGTAEEIAWHKAGVLKRGVTGFTRALGDQPGVMAVLRSRAAEKGATLVEVTDEVARWGGVAGTLQGEFQKQNQALAVMAVRKHLGMTPAARLKSLPLEMIEGLREARLRGRCEVIEDGQVTWLLDGAHTGESLDEVKSWLTSSLTPEETVVLLFNQQERNVAELLAGLLHRVAQQTGRQDVFRSALFSRNDVARPAEGETVDVSVQESAAAAMREIIPGCRTEVFSNVGDAMAEARRQAGLMRNPVRTKILVTGSLHLVGGVLRVLEPEEL